MARPGSETPHRGSMPLRRFVLVLGSLAGALLSASRGDAGNDARDQAYAQFIGGLRAQVSSSRPLVIGRVKDYPRGAPSHLELFLAFASPRQGEALHARLVRANGIPVYHQLYNLARADEGRDAAELLRRIDVTDLELSEDRCPALRKAHDALLATPWTLPLGGAPEFSAIHPTIFHLLVRSWHFRLDLELEDPRAPGYDRMEAIFDALEPCLPASPRSGFTPPADKPR